MEANRQAILEALGRWIRQRPGLDPRNYGDVRSYRSELRGITGQRHDAERMMSYLGWRESITAEHLRAAFGAYSGRLTLQVAGDGAVSLSYCTGQYWPTEYRAAACAVMGSAIFHAYVRDAEEAKHPHPGDYARQQARREFGRRLQERWID